MSVVDDPAFDVTSSRWTLPGIRRPIDFDRLESRDVTSSAIKPYVDGLKAFLVHRLSSGIDPRTIHIEFEAVRHALSIPEVVVALDGGDRRLLSLTRWHLQHGQRSPHTIPSRSRAAANVSEDVARRRIRAIRAGTSSARNRNSTGSQASSQRGWRASSSVRSVRE